MANEFQDNINLNGNYIKEGGFENLQNTPTSKLFPGRQYSIKGFPCFYSGTEEQSFWFSKKANAEITSYINIGDNYEYEILFSSDTFKTSRNICYRITPPLIDNFNFVNFFNQINEIPRNIRYNIFFELNPVSGRKNYNVLVLDEFDITSCAVVCAAPSVVVDNKHYHSLLFQNQLLVSVQKIGNIVYVDYFSHSSNYTLTPIVDSPLYHFCETYSLWNPGSALKISNPLSIFDAIINQIQTSSLWNLAEQNSDINYNIVSITNSNDSIFPKLLENYEINSISRNIYVDLSEYNDENNTVVDIFGNLTNIPIGVRFELFLIGNKSITLQLNPNYHTTYNQSAINFVKACKIEFIRLNNNLAFYTVDNFENS